MAGFSEHYRKSKDIWLFMQYSATTHAANSSIVLCLEYQMMNQKTRSLLDRKFQGYTQVTS
jgi:hypothetical protein